jgi:hypothetical protein
MRSRQVKKGKWMPVDKRVISLLPTNRPYTESEALLSVQADLDNVIYKTGKQPETEEEAINLLLSHISISAYASLWRWSRTKTRNFIKGLGSSTGHVVNKKGTGKGHPIRLVINNIQVERNTLRTGKGQVRDTSYNPLSSEPLSQEKRDKSPQPKAADDRQDILSFERYCRGNTELYTDKIEAISDFLQKYENRFGKPHPPLTRDQWDEAVGLCFYVADEHESGTEIGLDDFKQLNTEYFKTEYQPGCDYRLMHRVNMGIQKILYYEHLY